MGGSGRVCPSGLRAKMLVFPCSKGVPPSGGRVRLFTCVRPGPPARFTPRTKSWDDPARRRDGLRTPPPGSFGPALRAVRVRLQGTDTAPPSATLRHHAPRQGSPGILRHGKAVQASCATARQSRYYAPRQGSPGIMRHGKAVQASCATARHASPCSRPLGWGGGGGGCPPPPPPFPA